MIVKPGDTIPIKGLDVTVVAASGEAIAAPSGAAANPACSANVTRKENDPSDNAQSAGFLLKFGEFPVRRFGRSDLEQGNRSGLPRQSRRTR